jgi:glyoxylase-like metal-dependent hydrolase (beta-lactamase superfamily II)
MPAPSPSPYIVPIQLGIVQAFLLRGKRPILVDTGTPDGAKAIVQALLKAGIEPADLDLILLTHGHYDHAGNAAALLRMSSATLAIGLGDGALVRKSETPSYRAGNWLGRLFLLLRRVVDVGTENHEPAQPHWYIAGELDLHPYGIPGRVIPTPGHTPGSLSILLETGEAIVGDLIGGLPIPQLPGRPLFIHDEAAWRESLRRVLAARPRLIYPSHGGPFTFQRVARAFPWAAPA